MNVPDAITPEPARCNTVPIEKGTETWQYGHVDISGRDRCNTVPIEKGTETHDAACRGFMLVEMQHRPHREGD